MIFLIFAFTLRLRAGDSLNQQVEEYIVSKISNFENKAPLETMRGVIHSYQAELEGIQQFFEDNLPRLQQKQEQDSTMECSKLVNLKSFISK